MRAHRGAIQDHCCDLRIDTHTSEFPESWHGNIVELLARGSRKCLTGWIVIPKIEDIDSGRLSSVAAREP